ncbi:WD repeat-containing protein 87 [Podochytrium sp. JEL0797]|nr:WD repeat-containing protein 87 [Podochytrium sp. JEL0797]
MRQDTFLHYSPEGIEVWNLNSFWSTFSATGSQVTHLKRIEGCCSDPARILVATEDKSLHILSPVSGSTLFTAFPNMADIIIKEMEHDYPSATIWMLNSVGEISVYTTQTNPARIVDIWEVEAGSERVVSMCALRKRYSCSAVTDPVYALLGGTVAGQIVFYPVNIVNSKYQVIIQAHASAVVAIGCYTDLMMVISLGSDGLIKIWRMEIINTAKNGEVNPTSKSPSTPTSRLKTMGPISLSLLTTITLPSTCGIATSFSLHVPTRTLAVSSSHNLIHMYSLGDTAGTAAVEKRRHPSDEDHTKPITCLVNLSNLNLFASSSLEGVVKIWDGYGNILLKEIQFGSSVLSICFLNHRGDLLIGTANQVILLKSQDYLPTFLLKELMLLHIPTDLNESPLTFDESLDFWQLYRENLAKKGKDLSRWHLEDEAVDTPGEEEREVSNKADELERKYAEAAALLAQQELEENQRKKKETWQQLLRRKKEMERTVTLSVDFETKPSKSSPARSEGKKDSAERKSFIKDEMQEDQDFVSLEDDFDDVSDEERDGMTFEADVESRRKRMSTFEDVQERQRKQVEHEQSRRFTETLNDTEVIGKFSGDHLTVAQRERLNQSKRRRSMLKNSVMYQKVVTKHNEIRSLLDDDDENDSESAGNPLRRTSTAHRRDSQASDRPHNTHPTFNLSKGISQVQETPEIEVPNEAPQIDAVKAQDTTSTTNHSILHNPNAPLFKAPKPNLVKKRNRSLQAGSVLPNSVAVANVHRDSKQFKHRRESAVVPGQEETDSKPAVEIPAKNFALPEYLRSRRKKDDTVIPTIALRSETPHPNISDEDDAPIEVHEEPKPIVKVNSIIIPPPDESKPIEVKPVVRIPSPPKTEPLKPPTPPPEIKLSMKDLTVKESSHSIVIQPEVAPIIIEKEPSRKPSVVAIPPPPPQAPPVVQKTEIDIFSLLSKKDQKSSADLDSKMETKPAKKTTPKKIVERFPSEPALVFPQIPLPESKPPTTAGTSRQNETMHIEDVHTKLMNQKAWSLLEIAQESDGLVLPRIQSKESFRSSRAEALDDVAARDWFRGLNGKEVNITNILEVTMNVMKTGYWREKVEAAKATLYLYHTFQKDLPNALNDIILPQLDLMNDESWQVRAQLSSNMAAYKINHPDIVMALIGRLTDKNVNVKKAAMNSLATFGISSKEALRNAMGALGVFMSLYNTSERKSALAFAGYTIFLALIQTSHLFYCWIRASDIIKRQINAFTFKTIGWLITILPALDMLPLCLLVLRDRETNALQTNTQFFQFVYIPTVAFGALVALSIDAFFMLIFIRYIRKTERETLGVLGIASDIQKLSFIARYGLFMTGGVFLVCACFSCSLLAEIGDPKLTTGSACRTLYYAAWLAKDLCIDISGFGIVLMKIDLHCLEVGWDEAVKSHVWLKVVRWGLGRQGGAVKVGEGSLRRAGGTKNSALAAKSTEHHGVS